MQQAIKLLQGDQKVIIGVQLGRQLFATLGKQPASEAGTRTLVFRKSTDECFADMYVHPQEIATTLRRCLS